MLVGSQNQTNKALSNNAIKFSGLGTTPSNHIQSIQIGNNISEATSPQQKLEIYAKTEILSNTFTASRALITGSQTSGNPSFWGLVSSASFVQIYENSISSWTKPDWAQTITVICIGAGGGGGGGFATSAATTFKTGGGGGAGGEMVVHTYRTTDLPASGIPINVGGAGQRGGVGLDGGAGGNSTFGNTTAASSYTVLEAKGGGGGLKGVSGNIASVITPGRATGKPTNNISTGAGAGGCGVATPDTFWGQMRFCDAPRLPYTLNDSVIEQSIAGLSGQRFIPSSVAPTGGGGGTGVNTSNASIAGNVGRGGSILSVNTNTGLAGGLSVVYSADGFINVYSQKNQLSSTTTPQSLENFYKYVKIGLGGRGGHPTNGQTAVQGGLYGGGGGGGAFNSAGANGGSGVVVIISEA
jgi:hypothetical protein